MLLLTGGSYPVIRAGNRSEVADEQKIVSAVFRMSGKGEDTAVSIVGINPLETFRNGIRIIQTFVLGI
jgi:hypothetical protein